MAGLNAGMRIKIAGVEDPEVLVTEVRHRAQDYSHWTAELWGKREPVPPSYGNDFVCIPKTVPFRPARVTPKTRVYGPQTAIVTVAPRSPGLTSTRTPVPAARSRPR